MNLNYNSGMLNGLGLLKAKRNKMTIRTFVMLIAFGIAFIAVGIFIFNSQRVDDSWVRTQGQVIGSSSRISDGSTLYTPIISYEVDGKTYKVTSKSSSSLAPSVGETREVAYDPAQPNVATASDSASTLALFLIFPVAGAIILIAAPIFFVKSLRRSSRIEQLIKNGRKLDGVLVDVSRSDNGSVVVTVAAVDTNGETRNYVSDSIIGAAGLALADFRNQPIPISVYVDPSNPNDYYVDISDIPNLTPQRMGELLKKATQKNNPSEPQTIMNVQAATVPTESSAAPYTPPVSNQSAMATESPATQPFHAETPVSVQPTVNEPQVQSRGTIQPPSPRL